MEPKQSDKDEALRERLLSLAVHEWCVEGDDNAKAVETAKEWYEWVKDKKVPERVS